MSPVIGFLSFLTCVTACEHAWHMSKMIQIRNVPIDIHRALKVRAAKA